MASDNIVDIIVNLDVDPDYLEKIKVAAAQIGKELEKSTSGKSKNPGLTAMEKQATEVLATARELQKVMRQLDKSRGDTESKPFRNLIDVDIQNLDASVAKITSLYSKLDAVQSQKVSPDFGKQLEELGAKAEQSEQRYNELVERRGQLLDDIEAKEKRIASLKRGMNKNEERLRMMEAGTYSGKQTSDEVQGKIDAAKLETSLEKQTTSELYKQLDIVNAEVSAERENLATLREKSNTIEKIASNEELIKQYAEEGKSQQAGINAEIDKEAKNISEIESRMKATAKASGLFEDGQKKSADATDKASKSAKNMGKNTSQATAHIYYQLRAVKMLSHEIQKLDGVVDNFGKKFTNALAKSFTGLMKLGTGLALFRRRTKSANKEHEGFISSLKHGFMTVLKYSLGIRSFYFLINKLRKALGDSMGTLAQSSDLVNQQMSSLLSNVSWMKNMLATVAQPLLNVLVPAMEAVANAFNNAAKAVASFFATLTGQSFIFKAIKPTEDYAAALDKTAGAAKKAKDNLQSFDELHVISDDSGSGGASAGSQFETAETESAASELANKVKDIMSTIFDPIKEAWDDKGKFVMDSWKYAVEEVGGLIKQVGQDFLTVWSNDTGVHIWENIFQIVGDVGLVIGNIANNLTEAWIEGDKGLHIFEGIQRLIDIIIQGITNCADATVVWSQSLDFNPLLESILGLIQALESPIQHITDMVEYMYTNVVLPFMKYMIEGGIPNLLSMLGEVANAIDWDLLESRMQKLMDAFEPFLEKVWEAFGLVLEDIGKAIADLVNSDGFGTFIDLLVQLMNDADPREIADAIETLAKALIGLKIFTTVTSKVLDFLEAMLAVKVLFANFGVGNFITGIKGIIAPLSGVLKVFGGISAIVMGVYGAVTNFFEMLQNGFSWLNEILMVISIAIAAVGAVILGAPALVAAAIAGIIAALATIVVVIKDNWDAIVGVIKSAWEAVKKFFSDIGKAIVDMLASGITAIGDFFSAANDLIISAWNVVSEFFGNIVSFLIDGFNAFIDFIKSGIDVFVGFISNCINAIVDFVSGCVTTIRNFVSDLISKIKFFIDGFVTVFKNTFNAVKTFVVTLLTTIFNFVVNNIINPITSAFSTFFTAIADFASSTWDTIVGILSAIWSWIDENVITPVADLFTSLWDGITEGIKTAINVCIGVVETLVNAIIDAINTLSWDVPDWVPGIGGTTWGFDIANVELPRLAQGAVIPPNKEFMAILGDQKSGTNIEAPLSTIQDAVALVLQPYLERLIAITEDIYEKDTSVNIGDAEIARANIRGKRQLGAQLRTQ